MIKYYKVNTKKLLDLGVIAVGVNALGDLMYLGQNFLAQQRLTSRVNLFDTPWIPMGWGEEIPSSELPFDPPENIFSLAQGEPICCSARKEVVKFKKYFQHQGDPYYNTYVAPERSLILVPETSYRDKKTLGEWQFYLPGGFSPYIRNSK